MPSFENKTHRPVPFVVGKNKDGSPKIMEVMPGETKELPDCPQTDPKGPYVRGLRQAGVLGLDSRSDAEAEKANAAAAAKPSGGLGSSIEEGGKRTRNK